METATRKFFGRRKGRPLSDRKADLIDTLLPEIRALPTDIGEGEITPADIFGKDHEEYWLEIGFGAGEHLAAQATNNPQAGIIGCEPFMNGVARLLTYVEEGALENVRIHADDARDLVDRLPDASLDRLFILFPDPWPKKRHNERRIINKTNLVEFARVLKDGAIFRAASDHADYVRWMLHHILDNGAFEWLDEGPKDWYHRNDDWPATRYEMKALAGRPHYLTFRRKPRAE